MYICFTGRSGNEAFNAIDNIFMVSEISVGVYFFGFSLPMHRTFRKVCRKMAELLLKRRKTLFSQQKGLLGFLFITGKIPNTSLFLFLQ